MRRVVLLLALAAQGLPRLNAAPDLHVAAGVLAADALRRPTAGISLLMARRSGIIAAPISRAFGFADAEGKVPVTPDTIFHIASVSKYIEAAVAVRLVEQGKLSLDEDITRYVPDAPTHGTRVTIRHLLTHTSGIYNFTSLPDAAANEALDRTHDEVLASIRSRPLDFAPGTSWRYSNTGFYLVGMAIEKVTGRPYAAYLRDSVFAPLQMDSASLCDVHRQVPGLALGHVIGGGKLAPPPPMTWTLPFAAGSVCATTRDLLRWETALDQGRFISPAHVQEMRLPTVLADGTRIDYGLGTRLGSLQGHAVVGHTGSGGGFNTALEYFPNDQLTVVVLTNTDNHGAASLAGALARSAFELGPSNLTDSAVPDAEAAALTGVFESDDGAIESYRCGEKLCGKPPGAPQGRALRRQGPFRYAADADTEVRFQQNPRGSEWGFVYTGGLLVDAKRRVSPR